MRESLAPRRFSEQLGARRFDCCNNLSSSYSSLVSGVFSTALSNTARAARGELHFPSSTSPTQPLAQRPPTARRTFPLHRLTSRCSCANLCPARTSLRRLMLRLPTLLAFLLLARFSSALYFYLEAGEKRCFLEELPKDTIVVGQSPCALEPSRRGSSRSLFRKLQGGGMGRRQQDVHRE